MAEKNQKNQASQQNGQQRDQANQASRSGQQRGQASQRNGQQRNQASRNNQQRNQRNQQGQANRKGQAGQKPGLDGVIDFCKKNIRYILAGVIAILLIVVLAVAQHNASSQDGGEVADGGTDQDASAEGLELPDGPAAPGSIGEDVLSGINTLIENYYAAYAANDMDALGACAKPLTDLEKSYIGVFSQYVERYENIDCYTQPGLSDGDYAVSVSVDVNFVDADTTAPGLDFFYVRTDGDGTYYIDNLYSQFNWEMQEQEMDSQVKAFIEEYEQRQDVVSLVSTVQERYDEALATDEALKVVAEETLPEALRAWGDSVANFADNNAQPDAGTEGTDGTEPEDGSGNGQGDTEPEGGSGNDQGGTEPEDGSGNDQGGTESENTETVYVIGDDVNIRSTPDEDGEILGKASSGESFTRVSTTDDGWSEISYEGGSAYIKNDFVSTQAPDSQDGQEENQGDGEDAGNQTDYLAEGTVLTASDAYNVRSGMSEDADRIGTVAPGDKIEVVMSYAEGWTKVKWNGQTGYIRTDLLLEN